jgi:uncharacterized protein YjbJ (UPF0337 family)
MSGTTTTTSTTDPGDRSAAEIEREVEATRANLTGTLEELRDRASPGQLFEQAIDYARTSGGAEFARNLGQAVRDNPLPLLLIGAGIGWLMLSGSGGGPGGGEARTGGGARPLALPPPAPLGAGARHRVYGAGGAPSPPPGGASAYRSLEDGPSLTERASGMAGQAADRIGEAAGGLRDSVAGAADQAAGMAGAAYRGAADAASGAADSIGSAASSAARYLSDAGQGAREYAEDLGESARYGAGWLLQEQPLVLGAIGVALGAAVGALLPGTETEDRLMGETRDAVADRAQALAQEGYERVRETAGEHLENAKAAVGEAAGQTKDRLDQGGASVQRAGDALGDAARGLRQAVRDAAQDVAGEAKAALGAGGDAQPPPRQEGGPMAGAPSPSPERPGPV